MPALREPWRTRVLWVSLAGNLFAGTVIGSHMVLHRPPGPPGLEGAIEHMARNLPPPDAAEFRAVLDRERPWYDMARSQMEAARLNVAHAIAQEPLDPALVHQRMQEMQARWVETSTRFGESLIAAMARLSPAGRAKLAEAAARPPGRP